MKQADTPDTPPPRKKMPAEVFVKMWGNDIAGKEDEWKEWVIFDYFRGMRRANLSNIEIEGDVRIEITQGAPATLNFLHLTLSNCILSDCELINVLAGSISIDDVSKVGKVTLWNSRTEEIWIDNSVVGNFKISQNSVIGDIAIHISETGNFEVSSSTAGNFMISDSKGGLFLIRDSSTVKNFLTEHSIIKGFVVERNSTADDCKFMLNSESKLLSVSKSKIRSFTILSGSVTGNFEIYQSTTQGFFISDSTIQNLDIAENCVAEYLTIRSSIIGNFSINDNSKAKILSIGEKSIIARIRIRKALLERIEIISYCFVGYMKCQLDSHTSARLIFEGSKFGCLDFNKSVFLEFTTLNMLDCQINRLSLNGFCNFGSIFFSNLMPLETWADFKTDEGNNIVFNNNAHQFESISRLSSLHLTDSDLGKMQFINCNLRQFKRFEFSNTKMLEVFVAGSQMPDDEAFRLPNDEKDPLKIAEQKRLAYGQFKKIYEARGDTAGALRYLAFEMQAYREELRLEKPKNRKEWFDNRGERFILWLNRHSTNYGNNWHRGFWMTLGVMAGCFTLYCWTLGFWFGPSWATFFDLASYAPHYLNPFRDADSTIPASILPNLEESEKKWRLPLARIIDYASRVIVAYFVYQTIQAFRKLGKSSG